MKQQGHQIRAVTYDALARQFEAEVSFIDVRGLQRKYHVTAPGTPDQAHEKILSSLLDAAKSPRKFGKGA
ncbi:hypothetical protein [Oceaniovalibus sp. ACAM 378]|uniref:hypothetical protein n=1 Tax=Oceaniovalibus sp. ACAM 378 TaxID=2599923 RepID=UPI0011D4C609|nr:hypothetical protein [Oceaniovalibus sp. ACAM 378]TYB86318.1 hypothetical protein FQ320_16315 [Oceaniovalibus sp. ACAM 378]